MKPTTYDDYRRRIEAVLRHVRRHLDAPLPPAELARVACLSSHHFQRIFRGMVGESLAGHVRRMRLERAALRLRGGEATVLEVALDSGYTAHEPFTRAFRRHFGVTPTAFRERDRGARLPAVANGIHFTDADPVLPTAPAPMENVMLDVQVRTLDPLRLAAIRHVGPYQAIGGAFERLMGWAFQRGLVGPGALTVGVYHDDPNVTSPDELRADAGVSVAADVQPDSSAGVSIVDVPRGEYAVGTLRGSYEQLPAAYDWLIGQWLPSSGREADDRPCLDVYRNSPMDTAPEDLVTEIYLPLK